LFGSLLFVSNFEYEDKTTQKKIKSIAFCNEWTEWNELNTVKETVIFIKIVQKECT